jgi:hypothetical protein
MLRITRVALFGRRKMANTSDFVNNGHRFPGWQPTTMQHWQEFDAWSQQSCATWNPRAGKFPRNREIQALARAVN